MRCRPASAIVLALCTYVGVSAQVVRAPRIWDDAALADWATPVAGLNVRPAHYSSAEYYAAPEDNLATYPFYPSGLEPAGYWEWLQRQKPKPLLDARELKTSQDWIAAGERVFREMDSVLVRTNDPEILALARDPRSFANASTQSDGSFVPLRWVVTSQGVMLSAPACAACHAQSVRAAANGNPASPAGEPAARGGRQTPLSGPQGTARRLLQFYSGDPLPVAFWKEFTVPWAPDDRVEAVKTMTNLQALGGPEQLGRSFSGGMFARANGSPFYATRILDLRTLRYNRYMDTTATHRLRGAEDVARYAALVTGADRMDFGPYRILSDAQRRVRFRYSDEVLYAIGVYLMSLGPPGNPAPAAPDVIARGERHFRSEGCGKCHAPPDYTTGGLTPADAWEVPADHPSRADILERSVGTDPGTALRTRKGTGLYRIPSLRGVWSRRLLLHDGAIASLEELFDAARLRADYEPKGWNPPGVNRRAVPGHRFGLDLEPQEKAELLAFLRSL